MEGLTIKIHLKRDNKAYPYELTKESIRELKLLGLELKTSDDEIEEAKEAEKA